MQNPHMIDVVKKLDNLREMSPDSLNSQIDNIGNHIAHVRREVADLERMDTAGGGDIDELEDNISEIFMLLDRLDIALDKATQALPRTIMPRTMNDGPDEEQRDRTMTDSKDNVVENRFEKMSKEELSREMQGLRQTRKATGSLSPKELQLMDYLEELMDMIEDKD